MDLRFETCVLGDREFRYTKDRAITIPRAVLADMYRQVSQWERVCFPERSYPMLKWGVPTIILRFDGVFSPEASTFDAYELESTPAGIGYARLVSDYFRERVDFFAEKRWPPFAVYLGKDRADHDDQLWLTPVSLDEAAAGGLLIIRDGIWRNDPDFKTYIAPMLSRSMTPLWSRHDKAYGERMGWWKEVHSHDENPLPWENSFVLKPVSGSQSVDVFSWGPGMRGKSTRSQLESALARYRRMHLQRYIEPMKLDIDGALYNVMLRPYFAYDPTSAAWEFIGGMWLGRPFPNRRIHWASDAISGPLLAEA